MIKSLEDSDILKIGVVGKKKSDKQYLQSSQENALEIHSLDSEDASFTTPILHEIRGWDSSRSCYFVDTSEIYEP